LVNNSLTPSWRIISFYLLNCKYQSNEDKKLKIIVNKN
jgi:hypothetical protein